MSRDLLHDWEARIIRWGIFVVFLFTFGEYVFQKVWLIVGPVLSH